MSYYEISRKEPSDTHETTSSSASPQPVKAAAAQPSEPTVIDGKAFFRKAKKQLSDEMVFKKYNKILLL